MTMIQVIRVLLVDEHDMVRSSLTTVLEAIVDFEIVGEATDGMSALQKVADLRPDVVLMDLNMPIMDGLTATKIIREKYPQTKVIVLTASMLEADTQTAATAGANFYLRKDSSIEEIVEAIRAVVQ
jgi:DNA-binding NarL/FixJ family response regulator